MKKIIALTVLAITVATPAIADEVKPITKVMLARLGWMQSIVKNQAYSRFDEMGNDAAALAAQAKKVGEASPAQFNKEMNLAIDAVATELADAAAKGQGAVTAAKIGGILGKCTACHAKLRDK